jgi:N-acetylneuraminic acid mutarotase
MMDTINCNLGRKASIPFAIAAMSWWGKAKSLQHDPSLHFATAWQDLPPLKTPPSYCGMAMWGSDKIIVVGGLDEQFKSLRNVEMYDISSRQWTELPPLSQPRFSCTAIVVNDKLYVFGGSNAGPRLSECEVLDLYQSDSQFTRLPNDLPQALAHAVVVSKGHWIYVISGFNGNSYLNTVYALDTRTNEWNDKLPHMKEIRILPAVAILGDTLVVAGGRNSENGTTNYLTSVEMLDLKTSKWTNTIQSMPSPRSAAMAFVEQGSSNLIIAGGQYNYDKPATTYLRYNGNSWTEYGNFPR